MNFRSISVISTGHMIEYSLRRSPRQFSAASRRPTIDFGLYRGNAWCAELLGH